MSTLLAKVIGEPSKGQEINTIFENLMKSKVFKSLFDTLEFDDEA